MIKPEPEITGRLDRFTPDDVKQRRTDYIIARRHDGFTDRDIAEALGVGHNAVTEWMAKRGLDRVTFNYNIRHARERLGANNRLRYAIKHARKYLSDDEICEILNDELTIT